MDCFFVLSQQHYLRQATLDKRVGPTRGCAENAARLNTAWQHIIVVESEQFVSAQPTNVEPQCTPDGTSAREAIGLFAELCMLSIAIWG